MTKAVAKALASAAKKLLAMIGNSLANKNSEEKKNNPIVVIIAVIVFLLIIPIAALSAPGIMAKNTFDKISDGIIDKLNFSHKVNETQLYQKCLNVYIDYRNDYNEKVNDLAEQIKVANTSYDPETKTYYCPTVYTTVYFEEVDIKYMMAFLNTKYWEYQSKHNGYKFDKKATRGFLDSITNFNYTVTGGDPINLEVRITILSLDDMADKCFKDDYTKEKVCKKDLFLNSYAGLSNQ